MKPLFDGRLLARATLLPVAALFLAFMLGLAACQSTRGDLTPAQRVYAMRGELNIALEEAVAYAELPECTDVMVTACSDPGVVAAMLDAGEEADGALDEAEAIVTAPGSGDAALVYVSAARAALGRLAGLLIEESAP